MRKYISIEEEQQLQYAILKYVDTICKKERIQYFLAAGSCLGAVRNNNFIAWDDDIDIWMKRDQYTKFINVFREKYSNDIYFLQNIKTDKFFSVPGITRICINNTNKWVSDRYEKSKFNKGIFFDIFPLDYSSSNLKFLKFRKKVCHFLVTLGYKKLEHPRNLPIRKIIKRLPLYCTPNAMLNILYNNIISSNNSDVLTYYCSQYNIERVVYPKDCFDDAIYVKFNDAEFPVPCGYNKILSTLYGDNYMTPIQTKHSYDVPYYL